MNAELNKLGINKPYRVIISGGGTGGHIFPALAIAHEIRKRNPMNEILFVGSKHRMEMKRIPEAGYRIMGINISGFQRKKFFVNLSLPLKVVNCLVRCTGIIRKFKPQVAIGVGGYVSGPLLLSAVFNGVPTLIQEQNSFAGLTNKILGRYVDKICVAFDNMEKYFPAEKISFTGNPVKKEIQDIKINKQEAKNAFQLKQELPVLLVSGGSLGARTLNLSVVNGLEQIYNSNIQLLWQTGEKLYDEFLALFESRHKEIKQANDTVNDNFKDRIKVLPFINNMHLAYSASDVVVCRAGALTIAEICTIKIPCIMVPSPNVTEDHQTRNAQVLVKKGAGCLIHDTDAPEQMMKNAIRLVFNEEEKKRMISNMSGIVPENATEKIADEVEQLIVKKFKYEQT